MRRFTPLGLRARLALALVGVAVLAVGLATFVSNRGLHSRVTASAEARLERSAQHFAEVAAAVYEEQGGWTPQAKRTLDHLALLDGLRFRIGGTLAQPSATATVVVSGRPVDSVAVAPSDGQLLTPEEQELQSSVDRLHLAAGAVSVVGALLLAFLLAETLSRPLRRIRDVAQRIEEGDLTARVEPSGDPEMRAVGQALNRLADTLQQEDDLRKSSVADLAHELRTPVSGLLSRIEAAQDGVLEDGRANLAAMHTEALRLARLLDDLDRLADAQQPGLLLEKQPVDLAAIVAEQARAYEPRFADAGLAFTTALEPPAWTAGNASRLGQVAANLLENALRYSEPGGVVSTRVKQAGENVILEVEDTGIGIAPEDQRHVFKRFWRGEKSRSRATGGAGIGLAIVEELVRAHNGTVDVESEVGRGSVFRVRLPVAAQPSAQRRARRTQAGKAARNVAPR